jgi:O-antigen ligase
MSSYKQYKEYPEYRNVITLDQMKAHNIYLQLAGEIGLVGLAVFLWLLVVLFNEATNIYKSLKDNYFKIAAISLIGCLIAFLVNGLTESSLQYSRVALIFWYLCGLALSLKKFTDEDKKGFKG